MPLILSSPMHRRAAVLSSIAFALHPWSAKANGSALSVTPLFIELGPGRGTTMLEVTNRSDAAIAAQLRAFAWSQNGETDQLTPTSDLLISPGVARLGPSEDQVIRLALRRPPGAEERTYRLLLDQIPNAAAQRARTQVQIALRLSLPVRVAGTATSAPNLAWRAERGPGGAVRLVVRNDGRSLARIGRVEVVGTNGRRIAARPLGQTPYVLPGVERRWEVAAAVPRGGSIRVVAATNIGAVEQSLPLID